MLVNELVFIIYEMFYPQQCDIVWY